MCVTAGWCASTSQNKCDVPASARVKTPEKQNPAVVLKLLLSSDFFLNGLRCWNYFLLWKDQDVSRADMEQMSGSKKSLRGKSQEKNGDNFEFTLDSKRENMHQRISAALYLKKETFIFQSRHFLIRELNKNKQNKVRQPHLQESRRTKSPRWMKETSSRAVCSSLHLQDA